MSKERFLLLPSVSLEDDIKEKILWAEIKPASELGEVLNNGRGGDFVKRVSFYFEVSHFCYSFTHI